MTEVSNPYLSQLEQGLHQPSVRVLKVDPPTALNVSAGPCWSRPACWRTAWRAPRRRSSVESAIRTDPIYSDDQKRP